MFKITLASAVAALAVVALAGCSTSEGAATPANTSSSTAAAEASTPTPTADPALGSRRNPYPLGTPGKYAADSIWTVAVTSTDPDAWPKIQAANQYNEAPPAGHVDVIGSVTITTGTVNGDTAADPSASLDVQFVGTDGNSYDTINHPCGVIDGTELQDAGAMYSGATKEALVCAQVPASAVTGGTWSVTFLGGGAKAAFFAAA